ncbi:MAG: methylated-DNA--[protein]-cysteine S-methyltransferase [Actinomycetales bacterium]|nr:methylated-DNA--[protein]-cysteine S-methyltransferase [Actinomycetales bacterium]
MAARASTPGCLSFGVFGIPGGDLAVIADDGVVVSTSFRGVADALERITGDVRAEPGSLNPIAAVLERYAHGDLHALEEVAVRQPGGPFRQQAWARMRQIRAGSVDTYAGLAARAGSPRACRAAGTACAMNLVAPFVPCHRIVASDGIGAYGYGVHVKAALLAHEGISMPIRSHVDARNSRTPGSV